MFRDTAPNCAMTSPYVLLLLVSRTHCHRTIDPHPLAFAISVESHSTRVSTHRRLTSVITRLYEPRGEFSMIDPKGSSGLLSSVLGKFFPFNKLRKLTKLLFRGVSFRTARPKAPLWPELSSCLRIGIAGRSSGLPSSLLSLRYLYSNSCCVVSFVQ